MFFFILNVVVWFLKGFQFFYFSQLDNGFTGEIPDEIAISLNLSCNSFAGAIPSRFSSLVNLGTLDISHNRLAGNLNVLADLQNLVSLNISFNEFSGELPNTLFFRKLPLSVLVQQGSVNVTRCPVFL